MSTPRFLKRLNPSRSCRRPFKKSVCRSSHSRVLGRKSIETFVQFVALIRHESRYERRRSSAGPFAHSNIRMVSRLKSRASLEWDTPTPKSRLPPRPTFLCDLDAHLLPTVDFSHFNNAKSIVRLGKADAGNARLAKSWNGKPGDLSLSFHPEHTSTPSRNGKRALSLSTRANVSNNFLNKSTTLAETSHTVPLISNWAPSTHLFTPASWPLKSAPFKRFPGSRVFDCYAFPPKLDSASVRECVHPALPQILLSYCA